MTKQLARITTAAVLFVSVAAPATLALAQDTTSTTGGSSRVNLSCVITALDKREAAIQSAASTHASAVQTALQNRKSALDSAWSNTDRKSRRVAIRAAWRDFQTAVRKTRSDYRTAARAAWNAFYPDRKSCGRGAASDDPATHAVDQSF